MFKDKLKIKAISVTVIASGLLTIFGIFVLQSYGLWLFVLLPLLMGVVPALIYGRKKTQTRSEARNLGFVTLAIYSILLMILAIEGLICIIMAAPIAFVLNWAGSTAGHTLTEQKSQRSSQLILLALLSVPSMAFVESATDDEPRLIAVKTSIIIDASPEKVWEHVVQFPRLPEPEQFLFKTGIAFPIDATIKGTGPGAIRYCNFSTGSFVEPITVWDEPRLLAFDVLEQPIPMKELSIYEDISAPHLHGFFVSRRGQFLLSAMDDGRTLLEGTTWYYHKISPHFYWSVWSDYIIHTIHDRVLKHIKATAERHQSKQNTKALTGG